MLKKSLADAMQGENRLDSGAYTAVREHFEAVFNAEAPPETFSAACQMGNGPPSVSSAWSSVGPPETAIR
jgi:hypothetical protein